MKSVAVALAATTLALAGSTLYFAHQLKLERAWALAAASRPAGAIAQPTLPQETASPSPDAIVTRAPSIASSAPELVPLRVEQRRDQPLDPIRVAELKAAFAPMMKESMAYAALNAHESERLLDLTAEAMLRGQDLGRECQSTPGCDIRATQKSAQDSLKREVERILGADKLQRLNTYDEFGRVKSFRSQLPAGQELSESTATRLGTELAEERSRRVDKAETAEAFNQRMYDRAAGVLTTEQLAFFRQRQEAAFGRD